MWPSAYGLLNHVPAPVQSTIYGDPFATPFMQGVEEGMTCGERLRLHKASLVGCTLGLAGGMVGSSVDNFLGNPNIGIRTRTVWSRAASRSLLNGARVGARAKSVVYGGPVLGGFLGLTIAGAGAKIMSGGCVWTAVSWARAMMGGGAGCSCQVGRLRFRFGLVGGPAAIKLAIADLSLSVTERARSADGLA
jgi:hypothetical protein